MDSRREISEQAHNDVYDSVDDYGLAAFEEGLTGVTNIIVEVHRREHDWHDRVRAIVAALLDFLDKEPAWATILLGESPVGNPKVDERRRAALATLTSAMVTQAQAEVNSAGWFVPALGLTAELVVEGIFSVLRRRMLEGTREPFSELAPSVIAFVTASCPGPARDIDEAQASAANESQRPAQRSPIRTTYRTTRVLSAIGDAPGLNNREIADAAGLTDEGQTSKLLRRLEQRGLLQNFGLGQPSGGANAWLLTAYGERVLDATRHSVVPGAGGVVSRSRVRGTA